MQHHHVSVIAAVHSFSLAHPSRTILAVYTHKRPVFGPNMAHNAGVAIGTGRSFGAEPSVTNPASLSAGTAMALVIVLIGGADALAQSRLNERASERAIVPPLPPMRTRPSVIVGPVGSPIVGPFASPIVGPIGSPNRNAMPPPIPNHPFDHDNDRGHERGAFAAGVAAGVVLGGALATPAPGGYYVPTPSPTDDPAGYCAQTYSSYDPQSGTYIGDDGNPHPCPP